MTLTRSVIFAASIAFASTALSSAAAAQDAPYVAPEAEMVEAMSIMNAMFPADTREEMMLDTVRIMGSQMADSLMQGPVFDDPGIRAIMDEFIADLPETMRPAIAEHLPAMIKATAIAYTREFTLEELQDINRFATTPSGRRYFGNVQSLLADPVVAETNQEFFQSVSEAQAAQLPLLQAKLMEYMQANPEVVERLREQGAGQNN